MGQVPPYPRPDNGIVKLAVQAMMFGKPNFSVDEVAVGNAVPWSCCTDRGTNANPTSLMQQRAVEFWRDLLDAWQPEFQPLILLGKIAANIMDGASTKGAVKLRLPSPNNIQRVCGMFDRNDLLVRYPEVIKAGEELAIRLTDRNVFFACHAISLGRRQLQHASSKE